jgi:uncharacterized membrane protein
MKFTNKLLALTAIAVFACTIGSVYAIGLYMTSTHAASTTILTADTVSFTETLNGSPLAQNAPVTFPNVKAGETASMSYAVTNSGNVATVFTVTSNDLPTDYSLTWEHDGETINSGGNALGSLTLSVPSSATEGTLTFHITVTATQV